MNIKAIALTAVLALLSACATCEHHPAACTAAAIVIGTSIALSARHGNDDPITRPIPQPRHK